MSERCFTRSRRRQPGDEDLVPTYGKSSTGWSRIIPLTPCDRQQMCDGRHGKEVPDRVYGVMRSTAAHNARREPGPSMLQTATPTRTMIAVRPITYRFSGSIHVSTFAGIRPGDRLFGRLGHSCPLAGDG